MPLHGATDGTEANRLPVGPPSAADNCAADEVSLTPRALQRRGSSAPLGVRIALRQFLTSPGRWFTSHSASASKTKGMPWLLACSAGRSGRGDAGWATTLPWCSTCPDHSTPGVLWCTVAGMLQAREPHRR